ncbi:MAG TPA: flippase-like domain-containing protein [Phycisphaerales bacterium]|nr:flippase-like domain-containing protein [Phycisphaerales bacterium]
MADAGAIKSKRIFLFLRVTVVVVGVIFAVIWLSSQGRWRKLREINQLVLAAALAVFILSQIIIGLRWWILLRTQQIFIPFWAAVRLYFLGWFYNIIMPGSVGGDLIRLWYVTKHTEKKFEAALSVLVDRVIGLISTLIIAAFFYTVVLRTEGRAIPFAARYGLLIWGLLCIILSITAAITILLLFGRGRALLRALFESVRTHGAKLMKKLTNAAVLYGTHPLAVLEAFALTVFIQIAVITAFWFIGKDLGIGVSIKYYYVFFTLVWVIGAIPVSVGGAVVVEGVLVVLFGLVGVDKNTALVLALCQRFIWYMASVPGAVIHLVGAHLPKDFFVDYDRAID